MEHFLDPQLASREIWRKPANVVFHVDPGVRARLGTLMIEGRPSHIEAHVRRELALAESAPYSRRELDRKIESLAAEWKELGY
jgi:outer membrane protein assembly factor BamA